MRLVAPTLVALAMTTGIARADFFSGYLEGTTQVVGQDGTVFETYNVETVTSIVGPYDFTGYEGTGFADVAFDPYQAWGTITWTDSAGDTLVMDFTGLGYGFPDDYQNAAGTWSMVSGTGAYAGLTGLGNWSRTFQFTDTGFAETTSRFGGTLVPAPGVLSLIGVGVLATGRRRR